MKSSIRILNNYEYKKLFLPDVTEHILFNESKIQVYRVENYLRNILIPVTPYRTTFNFLIFLRKGTLSQFVDGESFDLEKNQIINIKQGNITATLNISADAEGFFIVYENEVITDIEFGKNDLQFLSTKSDVSMDPMVASWNAKIIELLEDELFCENRDMQICISLFQSFLIKIIKGQSNTSKILNRQLSIVFQFRELVQKNHIDHKNVHYYAQQLNISENYLNKCVKEATNKPPKQWINEISILHSQILLQDATRDIASVAFELKYQSPSYFTRLFKKVTGYSPTEYRKLKFLEA